jgi:hypothetical protein
MISKDQKRQHVFSRMKHMTDTGWLYKKLQESDIPKTINANGIFLNLSCLSEEHLNTLYRVLADVKSTPIQSQSIEYIQPKISTVSHIKHKQTYDPIKLNKLQKRILTSL